MPIFYSPKPDHPVHWLDRIRIRQAKQRDLPALEWGGEFRHFRNVYEEAFRRTQMGNALIWLAELSHQGIIGQVFVQLKSDHSELADGFSRAYIYSFRVRGPYRGQGLGTRLLLHTENDLMTRGFQWATLNVGQTNPDARRLYERHGYRVVSEDAGIWSYFDDKGILQNVEEPAWRMIKCLAQ